MSAPVPPAAESLALPHHKQQLVEVSRGDARPMGASLRRHGVNFSVFSAHATDVWLLLFEAGADHPFLEWKLNPAHNRTGNVWHAMVSGVEVGTEYAFRMGMLDNPAPHIHRFDPAVLLLDPYAHAVTGSRTWRGPVDKAAPGAGGRVRQRRGRVVEHAFDWGTDRPLNRHLADSVIYELHVRGFTAHPSSGVRHPGTFAGLVEKIPHLKALGVTAVELMPVTEFEELDNPRVDPATGARLCNFWGYQPLSLFAPRAAYATPGSDELEEFRKMVMAFHAAGMEVFLDMVFNHSGEGDDAGPTVSWRGLDNATYYMLDPATGENRNFAACGNTFNCNHPVVRGMLLNVLRYWVTQMHVDGFRFDLASILGRGPDGLVMHNPPLLEACAADPVLAHVKLIAEAWDAAGLYQVGNFPHWRRWAEWNGRFRDDVRRFVRGDPGMTAALATRLAGSSDLYQSEGRAPYHSINFATSHDGATLADLFAFQEKHNLANGEGNRDGTGNDFGANGGQEGPTGNTARQQWRERQQRNMAAILLLSQGTPMLLGGDEMGRTQQGNNNAYCQDNEVSHLDWNLARKNAGLLRFHSRLVHFRLAHPNLRRTRFEEPDAATPWVHWHGEVLGQPDWEGTRRCLSMHLPGLGRDDDLLILLNASAEVRSFQLPPLPQRRRWHLVMDTMRPSPEDIVEAGLERSLDNQAAHSLGPNSVVLLLGRDGGGW